MPTPDKISTLKQLSDILILPFLIVLEKTLYKTKLYLSLKGLQLRNSHLNGCKILVWAKTGDLDMQRDDL